MKYFKHATLIFWSILLTAGIGILVYAASAGNTENGSLLNVSAVSNQEDHAYATRAQMQQIPALASAEDLAPLSRLAARLAVRAETEADRRISASKVVDEVTQSYVDVQRAADAVVDAVETGDRATVRLAASQLMRAGDFLQISVSVAPVGDVYPYGTPDNNLYVPTPFVDSFSLSTKPSLPTHEQLLGSLN